jgi:ELWxxDGT repeat protein
MFKIINYILLVLLLVNTSSCKPDLKVEEAVLVTSLSAGTDQSVIRNDLVVLESTYANNKSKNKTFLWTQESGTIVTINNSTSPIANFTAPAIDETLVFKLTVTDDGETYSATTSVSITNQSYVLINSTSYSWDDISASGDLTVYTLDDDDYSSSVTIPFDFNFFGAIDNQFSISSNGVLDFDESSSDFCCNGESLPTGTLGASIVPAWSDLNPNDGGTIKTATVGTSPNRKFIIEFDKVFQFDAISLGEKSLFSYDKNGETISVESTIRPDGDPSISYLTELNGKIYFRATDGLTGSELWEYDISSKVTTQVADINPGASSSSPTYLVASSTNVLYFSANDGVSGNELWKYDPASKVASRISDINAGSVSSNLAYLIEMDGILYFKAYNTAQGNELWKYDPAVGTPSLIDIRPGTSSSSPSQLFVYNHILYFSATGSNGTELWSYNPSLGTPLVEYDIRVGTSSSFPAYFTELLGQIYFRANNGATGYELFVLNPGSLSFSLTKEVRAGTSSPSPIYLNAYNGKIYFKANDGVNGYELWEYNPTGSVMRMVHDINPGSGSSLSSYFKVTNNKLFFSATDGVNGYELWSYDPSVSALPQLVKDIDGTSSGSIGQITSIADMLYFTYSGAGSSRSIYKYDTSTASTPTLAYQIDSKGLGSHASNILVTQNNELFFTASSITPPSNSFQVKISEGSSCIEIHCKNCNDELDYDVTQGIQNSAGTEAFHMPTRSAANFSIQEDVVQFRPGGSICK